MARKGSSGGWLAWWCAPLGSPTRPRRARSSRAYGPATLSWWLGHPGDAAPGARSGAPARRGARPRVTEGAHCPICGKGARCRCRRTRGTPIARKRLPKGQRYATPPDFRAQGAIWCGACRHRVNTYTGRCFNTRCPRWTR